MPDDQQHFDGFAVVLHEGRFTGTVDLDTDEAITHKYDDVVSFVVTTHVSNVGHGGTKLGDLKRTNAYKVQEAIPLTPAIAAAVFRAIEENSGAAQGTMFSTPDGLALGPDALDAPDADSSPEEEAVLPSGGDVIGRVGEPTDEALSEFINQPV